MQSVFPEEQRAEFFLTYPEMTEEMRGLEDKYGNIQQVFAQKWLEKNLFNRSIIDKIGSIHLSDCKMKTTAYFKNGILIGKYNEGYAKYGKLGGYGRIRSGDRPERIRFT